MPVDRDRVWEALTDPALVARLTPFVRDIEADGERWIWTLSGITVLGKGFSATFTEKMTLTEKTRIEFTHEPPDGATERAGVHGWYSLADHPDGVELETKLQICVDLPLPRLAGAGVRTAMRGVMATMGDRFSKNLLDHLGAS